MTDTEDFLRLWDELAPIGRSADSGGYRRYVLTDEDATLREWFAATAAARGLEVTQDRAGNQWAWWGDPDARPGLVIGSHLDSVPDGGAFDGPLGVVSAFLALDELRARGVRPARPVGVACFADEEGARFGVACGGSRLLTGALEPDRAMGLRDGDGVELGEALSHAGRAPVAADPEALRRVGAFVELHVEQGRGLQDLGLPVAVASEIIPHGRWRLDFRGEANHAGTTRLEDRHDAMLGYAGAVLEARRLAASHGVLATCGKVAVTPGGVNAVPAHVTAWLDARGDEVGAVWAMVAEMEAFVAEHEGEMAQESWTDATRFDDALTARVRDAVRASTGDEVPVLGTGAGHDAGILALAGVPAAMLFVRNPTGVSHSPAEHAEVDDCVAGVHALASVVEELSR